MVKTSGNLPRPVLRAVEDLLGPDAEAKLLAGLTPDEEAAVDARVARFGGSHAAALGVTDPELAAMIDDVCARGRAA